MINKLENYKVELERVLLSLAKQDFVATADGIARLIKDFDFLIKNKEIAKQEVVDKNDLNAFGLDTDGLPDTDFFLLTKVLDISDIENTIIKDFYIQSNNAVYVYDSGNGKWIIDSIDD